MRKLCLLQKSAVRGGYRVGYLNFNECGVCQRDYCFLETYESIEDEFNPMLEPMIIDENPQSLHRKVRK